MQSTIDNLKSVKIIDEQEVEIQAIFDKVIKAGLYPSNLEHGFMCHSLKNAYKAGYIDRLEVEFVQSAIDDYLPRFTLTSSLSSNGLPNGVYDMLKIYSDWKNRPTLELE